LAQFKLYKLLKSAVKEEDVAHMYRMAFQSKPINGELALISQHPKTKVDGWLQLSDFAMLLEFKYDKDFTKHINVIEVIIQVLYYLKRLEEFGEDLPDVCFVGDINECFYFHTNDIVNYLSEDTDWSLAPSVAGKANKDLFKLLYNDAGITPFIHTVDKNFDIQVLIKDAVDLSKNITQKRRISEKNINRLFNYFTERILRGKKASDKNANELVNIFLTAVINPDDNYLHPTKKNTLVTKSFGNVIVNGNTFRSFFKHYQRDYSPKDKDTLVGICDRLIEDTTRRFQGEFFTPTEWVDEAHRMIEEEFGENWKEDYVVYDPCCGTGNLTRDYKFKELYMSTLNQSDLDIIEQRGYNPEATKFQFDFLNDPDDEFPPGLTKALEGNKPLLVLMNPPYGRSSGVNKFGNIEAKAADTAIGSEMKLSKLGMASSQLYTQFLYRCLKMGKNNINISTFIKPLYLSGESYKKFRDLYLNEFEYISSMLFQASHFNDVSTQWGIEFSIWKPGKTTDRTNFNHTVKDLIEGKIGVISEKNVYNTDNGRPLNKFSNYTPALKDYPKFSSGLIVKETKYGCGIDTKSFSTMVSNANNVMKNAQSVYIINGGISENVGKIYINDTTFYKSVAIFAARKTIKGNWINDKDEYLAPNTEHPDYKQWNNDCLVYSLFNNSSNQSALRNITYKEKKWDIINEWLWLSNKEMMDLAEQHHNDEVYRDCKNFPKERFVYKKLQKAEISAGAKGVLDHATELLLASFEYRDILNEEHPEYHLNTKNIQNIILTHGMLVGIK
jgi:hypothetical protein